VMVVGKSDDVAENKGTYFPTMFMKINMLLADSRGHFRCEAALPNRTFFSSAIVNQAIQERPRRLRPPGNTRSCYTWQF